MDGFVNDLCVWICQVVRWIIALLDKHQGAFMVLLTTALVYYTYKSARAAVRNIELIKQNDDKRTLPYVILEVVNDRPVYGVRMVNLGLTAAHNVVVKAEPKIEIIFSNYRKPIRFLYEPVAYLAPSAHFETDIGSFRDIERENPSKIYTGTISFENGDGKRFEHEFVLDFSLYTDTLYKDEKTVHHVAKQLEELTREVRHIATGFHKPHILTEDFDSYHEKERKWIEEVRKMDATNDNCDEVQGNARVSTEESEGCNASTQNDKNISTHPSNEKTNQ